MAERVSPPEFSSEVEVAQILLGDKVFSIADYPKYIWSGGLLTPFYSNLRILHGDLDGSTKVVDHFVSKMQFAKRPDLLAGVVSAGPPWTKGVGDRLRIPQVPVRPNPKDHGAGDQVEGIVNEGDTVVIMEDTVSTGDGILKSAEAIRAKGAIVDTAYAISSYELFDSRKRLENAGIHLVTLTTLPDVLEVADQHGYWPNEQVDFVKDWHKDPVAWADKFST